MSGRSAASNQVAIVGYAHSQVRRHHDVTLGALAVETARTAIADAGLSVADIDGFVSGALLPSAGDHDAVDGVSTVSSNWMAENLGAQASYVTGFQGMGQIPGSVAVAVNAIANGAADHVLLHRALHNPAGRYHGTAIQSVRGPQQWSAPQGFFGPLAMIGLTYNEYLQSYGARRETMAKVVVEARKNGARIPWSYWYRKPLTEEEYLDAPMIAEPICRFDADLPVDGVATFVLTTAERARDLPHKPVYVSGYAMAVPPRIRVPMHWPLGDIEEAGEGLTRRLWEHSGVKASEVDLPQLYDGFSPFVYLWLEALGFCPRGEAHRFVEEGGLDSARPGALPALSGGGALGNGRMHGIPQMLECYLQLSDRAGSRQREGMAIGVACHSSPHLGGAVVYSSEPF